MPVYPYEDGRGRRRWRVVYDVAPHPDGRRRTTTKRGFATRREAVAFEDEQRGRRSAGELPTPTERTTVAAYLEAWVAGISVKPTTLASYRTAIRSWLVPYIGGVRLDRLTPEAIDACYRALEREGGRGGRPLSAKTVRTAHIVLHAALRDAVERGRLRQNPASLAHPPTVQQAESGAARRIWTAEQLRTWLDGIAGDRLHGAWLLLATTGLRRGELAGMPWDAVDLDGARVEVRQQLTVVDNRPVLLPHAKTARGRREFALDPETVKGLRGLRAVQARERLAYGAAYQDHGLVVCWEDGSLMHPARLWERLQASARRLGLPRITVHGLRHSYATAALRAGVSPEVLAARLGHADVATTLRIYAHVRREDDVEAAERAARWITG